MICFLRWVNAVGKVHLWSPWHFLHGQTLHFISWCVLLPFVNQPVLQIMSDGKLHIELKQGWLLGWFTVWSEGSDSISLWTTFSYLHQQWWHLSETQCNQDINIGYSWTSVTKRPEMNSGLTDTEVDIFQKWESEGKTPVWWMVLFQTVTKTLHSTIFLCHTLNFVSSGTRMSLLFFLISLIHLILGLHMVLLSSYLNNYSFPSFSSSLSKGTSFSLAFHLLLFLLFHLMSIYTFMYSLLSALFIHWKVLRICLNEETNDAQICFCYIQAF
jgi:hypothetical protein